MLHRILHRRTQQEYPVKLTTMKRHMRSTSYFSFSFAVPWEVSYRFIYFFLYYTFDFFLENHYSKLCNIFKHTKISSLKMSCKQTRMLLLICLIFFPHDISALVRQIIHGLKIRLPYTVVLLVLGVLFGLLSTNNATVHSYARVVETDPHLLLFIFLPVLIFESAFGMEVHTFMKTFMQVLLLAIPGLGKFTILLSCVQFDVCLVATLLGGKSQHADDHSVLKNSFGKMLVCFQIL